MQGFTMRNFFGYSPEAMVARAGWRSADQDDLP
jgi:hypothetical protein